MQMRVLCLAAALACGERAEGRGFGGGGYQVAAAIPRRDPQAAKVAVAMAAEANPTIDPTKVRTAVRMMPAARAVRRMVRTARCSGVPATYPPAVRKAEATIATNPRERQPALMVPPPVAAATRVPRVLTVNPIPMRAKARRAPPLMARRRKAAAPRVPRVLTANPISMKAKARRAPPFMARQRKAAATRVPRVLTANRIPRALRSCSNRADGRLPCVWRGRPWSLRIFSTWLSRPTLCCAAYGSQPAPQPYNYSQQAPPPAYGAQAVFLACLWRAILSVACVWQHSRLHRLPLACLRRFSNGPRTCGLD